MTDTTSTSGSADASLPRKNAENTRGKPFARGNAGRPPGARNKATLAVQVLLEGEAEALTRKLIERAHEGDMAAMKLVFDRIAPSPRERAAPVQLPEILTSRTPLQP